MIINRYTTPTVARYNPMSMEELGIAPTMLRQRHDETLQAASMLETQRGNYDVDNEFLDTAEQLTQPLKQNIESLVNDLTSQGVNKSQAVGRAMKLAGEYSNLFAPSGGIGQLTQRTGQYRQAVEQINKDWEDPLLRRYALSQLNIGKAKINPNTGRVELDDMTSPTMFKHIPEPEILDRLNDAVSKLKPSDLARSGINYTGPLGDFNDLYSIKTEEGVSLDKINKLIDGLLSPEEKISIQQYGKAIGMTEEEAMQSFNHRLDLMASANVTKKSTYRDFNITNQERLERFKKSLNEDSLNIPFIADGSRINVDVINPYSKLTVNDGKLTVKGITNEQGQQFMSPDGRIVSEQVATDIVSTNQFGHSIRTLKPGFKEVSADQTREGSELLNNFRNIKKGNLMLAALSDEEALEKVNNYYKDLTQQYGKVEKTSLNNPNFVRATLARGMNSSVFTVEGKQADLTKLMKDNGYEDYNEFIDKNKNAYQGYRKFGPNGLIVHEFVMSNGDAFFIEGEYNLQRLSDRTSKFNSLIISSAPASPEGFTDSMVKVDTPQGGQFVPVKQVNINPIATGSEPYSISIFPKDNRVNLNDVVLSRIAGKSPEQAIYILKNNYGYSPTEFKIETLSDINRRENDLINEELKYMNR